MPAIELARLRTKSIEIVNLLGDSSKFINECATLFEFYADQTRKDGLKSMPTSITPAYNIPKPVMRRLKYELTNAIPNFPKESLILSDALWHQNYLEFKELSVFILGNILLEDSSDIQLRLQKWNTDTTDENVQRLIAGDGTRSFRKQFFKEYKELCLFWLNLKQDEFKRTGIFLLENFVIDQGFEALPSVFSILKRDIVTITNSFYPYYRDLFKKIIPLSQAEATYFLKQQALMHPENKQLIRLVRQSIDLFDDDYKSTLQEAIKRG